MNKAQDLLPTLGKTFTDKMVVLVDVAVGYSESMKLTEKLGQLV